MGLKPLLPADAVALPDQFLALPLDLSARRRLYWLAAGFILIAGGFAALALGYARAQAIASGARLTESFAQVIEEQTNRTIQTIDQRLQLAISSLARIEASGGLNEQSARVLLREHVNELPFVRALWVMDAQGRIVYDSDEGNIGVSLADRPYFQIYVAQTQTGFYIGAPVRSRSTGTWLISAARPMRSTDGRFAGIIVAAVQPPYFDKLWRSIDLGPDGSVTLFRRDGVLMVRSIFDDAVIGKNFRDVILFSRFLPASPTGHYENTSPIDGVYRMYAYRTLSAWPDLVVLVGRSYQHVLAPWRELAALVLAIWATASAAIAFLCLFLDRAWQQRGRAESRFRQAAQRLALATEAAGIVVWDWDQKSDHGYATPSYFTTLGYPPSEELISSASWLALLHPDDKQALIAKIDAVLASSEQPYEYQARLRHADGCYRWASVIGRVTERDASGKPSRLLGVRIDITRQKQTELELRRAKEYAENLISTASTMIVGLDGSGAITLFNREAERITGYTLADLAGRNWFEVLVPRARFPQVWEAFSRLASGGLPSEFENPILTKSGEARLIMWRNSEIVEDGKLIGALSFGSDVTERRRAEQAVRDSGQRLRNLIDGLGPSMFVALTAPDGTLLEVNRPALAAAGLESDDVLGRPVHETYWLAHSEQVRQQVRAAVMRGARDEASRFDMEIQGSEHQRIMIDFCVQPLTGEGGQVAFLVLSGNVITERKLAETALRENARQLQALSRRVLEAQEHERRRVANELHDELGQVLTALKITLGTGAHKLERPARQQSLAMVDDALTRVRNLALALRPSILDDLGLAAALQWISQQTAAQTGVALQFDSVPGGVRFAPELEIACFRIAQQALTNIARHAGAREVRVSLERDAQQLVLRIRDDGCGFDVEAARARAAAGHSLGLLAMQERAALIGATLEIDSQPGHGTTLTLRCPWRLREEVA